MRVQPRLSQTIGALLCAVVLLGAEGLAARDFFMVEGTEIALRLRTTIDAKSSQVGDRVICTIEEAVVIDGMEVIPVGTRVHGRIADIRRAGIFGRGGELALTFDSIDVPGTGRIPISANVVHLNNPGNEEADKHTKRLQLGQEGEIKGPGPGKLKRYGTIAGATVGGTALGGSKGAAVGIGLGAAFSYIFWKGQEVNLPAGTGIIIETSRNLAFSIPEMPTAVGDAPRRPQ